MKYQEHVDQQELQFAGLVAEEMHPDYGADRGEKPLEYQRFFGCTPFVGAGLVLIVAVCGRDRDVQCREDEKDLDYQTPILSRKAAISSDFEGSFEFFEGKNDTSDMRHMSYTLAAWLAPLSSLYMQLMKSTFSLPSIVSRFASRKVSRGL